MGLIFSKRTESETDISEESDTADDSVSDLHDQSLLQDCDASLQNESNKSDNSSSDESSSDDSQNIVKFTKTENLGEIINVPKDNTGNLVSITGNTVLGNQIITIIQKKDELLHRTPLKFGLPFSPDMVIGREKEVDDLYELVKRADRVAITGMGGVGKTVLAIQCAEIWCSDENGALTRNVAFMNAENCEVFRKSVESLASELNIRVKNRETREIIREIFKMFSRSSLLMIYDNVEAYSVIKDYLPEKIDNIYVLATSQITELKSFFKCYELNVLNSDDSEKLLMNILSGANFKHIKYDEIMELIEIFGGLPLGLIQAAAYIKDIIENEDEKYSIREYIETYKEYLNQPLPDDFKTNYKHTVYISLKMNVDKIKYDHTKKILTCMSFMNPTQITNDIFTHHFGAKQIKEAIRELVKFSIVKKHFSFKEFLIIHRLIQEVCRLLLEDQIEYFVLVFKLTIMSVTTWDHSSHLLPHIEKNLVISVATEAYQQAFNSGPFLDNLKNDLGKLQLDLSASDSWNAWHYAVYRHDSKLCKGFSEKGLMYDCPGCDWSLLHVAAMRDSQWTINETLQYLSDVPNLIHATIGDGLTSLHIATILDCLQNVEDLIKLGCNVNICDNNGNTALHWAVKCRNNAVFKDSITEVLINSGADITIKNNVGRRPLENFQKHIKKTFLKGGESLQSECFNVGVLLTPLSSSGCPLSKKFITWDVLVNIDDGIYAIKTYLTSCAWWNEENETLLDELLGIVHNSIIAIEIIVSYIIQENISIKDYIKIFNDYENRSELEMFTQCCLDDQYKNIFKIICITIDKIKEKHPKVFEFFTYVTYCSRYTASLKFLAPCIQSTTDNINEYTNILEQYFLVTGHSAHELVSHIVHIYSICQNKAVETLESFIKTGLEQSDWLIAHALEFMDTKDIKAFYVKNYATLGQLELINKYIEGIGCTITITDDWTALHYACADRRYTAGQIVHKLIQLKVDNSTSIRGIQPIHLVSITTRGLELDLYKPFNLLLEKNFNPDVKTLEGLTPLHFAAFTGASLFVYYLTGAVVSVDVNVVDNAGNTPAHFAARYGHEKVLKHLLRAGADMTVENINKETPESLFTEFHKNRQKLNSTSMQVM